MNANSDRTIIIGGGFSGAAVAIQLARRGMPSTIVESRSEIARGAAYSTDADEHLLNVPAGKMGLLPDAVHAFADHVGESGDGPQDFVSRRRFGDYVAGELARAIEAGGVEVVRDRAVAARRVEGCWRVWLEGGGHVTGAALVLANGNQPPAPVAIPGLPDSRRADDPWSEDGRRRIAAAARDHRDLLLIGTGLTMVDVVLTLDRLDHKGQVTALSRRGLVPRSHRPDVVPQPTGLDEVPATLSRATRWLRRRAKASGDWRGAVDGMRPVTQAYWRLLTPAAKARFLRHARPWWDVHRHRIAPQAAAALERVAAGRRLDVIAGRVVKAVDGREGARIEIARRSGGSGMVEAALVINCTGPLAQFSRTHDPLLRQMLDEGLIRADELGLGVAVTESGSVAGIERLWAVGPMTKGCFWEITAVPDIRVQAEHTAAAIAGAFGRSLETTKQVKKT